MFDESSDRWPARLGRRQEVLDSIPLQPPASVAAFRSHASCRGSNKHTLGPELSSTGSGEVSFSCRHDKVGCLRTLFQGSEITTTGSLVWKYTRSWNEPVVLPGRHSPSKTGAAPDPPHWADCCFNCGSGSAQPAQICSVAADSEPTASLHLRAAGGLDAVRASRSLVVGDALIHAVVPRTAH